MNAVTGGSIQRSGYTSETLMQSTTIELTIPMRSMR